MIYFRKFPVLLGIIVIGGCSTLIANSLKFSEDVQAQSAPSKEAAIPLKVERLDTALDRLIPPSSKAVQIASGMKWTEGPLWLPSGKLIFAEIPSNSIRIWSRSGDTSIFMQPSGYKGSEPYGGPEPGSNAMTLDAAGRLTVAGHAQRDVWRLERLASGAPVTVLADTYQGKRLNSPNDLVNKSDGSLYFTDPPYGLPTQSDKDPTKELQVNGVYGFRALLSRRPAQRQIAPIFSC